MPGLITQKTFELAASGDVDAQLLLGMSYLFGENGLTQDTGKACNFLQKARTNGSGKACLLFVKMHEEGVHNKVDLEAALEWAREAQRLGAEDADQVIARISQHLKKPRISQKDATQLQSQSRSKAASTPVSQGNVRNGYFVIESVGSEHISPYQFGYWVLRWSHDGAIGSVEEFKDKQFDLSPLAKEFRNRGPRRPPKFPQ